MRLPDKIPQTFRQHKLTEVHYLQPAFPMMKLIENQVFLAQNSCIDVLGQADSLLALCRQFHYKLCEIHVLIQAAGACNALQYYTEAENYLKTALHLAEPDHLLVPFCENYYYIKELLGNSEFEQNIRQLSVVFEKNRDHLGSTLSRPSHGFCPYRQGTGTCTSDRRTLKQPGNCRHTLCCQRVLSNNIRTVSIPRFTLKRRYPHQTTAAGRNPENSKSLQIVLYSNHFSIFSRCYTVPFFELSI